MRRELIGAIGGVAAMPFVATAQQTARIPRLVSCMAARRMIQKNRLEIVSLEALGHKDCERPSVGSKKHLKRQPGFRLRRTESG